MKIVLAVKGMENASGGTERVVAMLVAGLRERGHHVTLMTFDRPQASSFYSLPEDLDWVKLNVGDVRRSLGFFEVFAAVRALRRALRQSRPDVVVGFMHSMFVPLAAAVAMTGIPLIASEHIVPEYYRRRRIEYALLQMGCLRARRVTVLSEKIRMRYPRLVRDRMVPMPNPVQAAHDTACNDGRHDDGKTVLTIGRMEPQKDQATLIHAFAQLAAEFPDWRLRIVGDGVLRPALETHVAEHGLMARVDMPGRVGDVAREYRQADLFVLPSLFESFGLVSAEALAHGLPVIGFADCAGTNEIVRHEENGLLVAGPDRQTALAEGMRSLMADPCRRARLAARAPQSVARFDPQHVLDRWEHLLQTVTG